MGNNGHESHYGEVVVPPFYGTGDMLSWSAGDLLSMLDRSVRADFPASPAGDEAEDDTERLQRMICTEELVAPRGYYSFFPVIVEGTRLIVLNPSDFHSELAALHLPPTESTGPKGAVARLRPEGSIIALVAVTLGPSLNREARSRLQDPALVGEIPAAADRIADTLSRRVITEIHRALFLPPAMGTAYVVGSPEVPAVDNATAIVELVCAEDRLGISASEDGCLVPPGSRLTLFLP